MRAKTTFLCQACGHQSPAAGGPTGRFLQADAD